MSQLLLRMSILLFFVAEFSILPAYGQNHSDSRMQQSKESFIHKGKILTGFTLGFTNATGSDYNQDFPREITEMNLQLNALYFVSDHIGIGPLVGYQFTYRDLVPYRRGSPDIDTRSAGLEVGAQGGYYFPASDIFGGNSDIYFL